MPKGIPKNKINKGWFRKDKSSWNKNLKGEEVKKHYKNGYKSIFIKGQHISPETEFKKGEMRLRQLGENNSSWKGGLPKCKVCGELLEDYRTKLCRKCFKGKNHFNWQGGDHDYGIEFNKFLKEQIRKRDNYRCQECFRHQDELFDQKGKKYQLLVHHIDYNKRNNQENNLISLCRGCHLQTNYKREDWTNYFKEKILV